MLLRLVAKDSCWHTPPPGNYLFTGFELVLMKLSLFSCQRNKFPRAGNFAEITIRECFKPKLSKRNRVIKAEILIKSGDGNTWTPLLPVDSIKHCVDSLLHLFLYHVLFNNKHNILHYITNLPCIEQLTDYSNFDLPANCVP